MRFGRPAVLVLAVAALSGCFCHFVRLDEDFANHALQRASFDMNCPPDKLTSQFLEGSPDGAIYKDTKATVGVRGCGRRATYVLVRGQWILNGMVQEDAAPSTTPAPPPPPPSEPAPREPNPS